MSFRYKSALLTLITLVAVYGYYFARVVVNMQRHDAIPNPVGLLLGVVVAIAVVGIVGHVIIAATSADRWGPMDERERKIDRRATSIAYYLMIAGALLAVSTIHLSASKGDMANAVLLAIVVVECTRQAIFLALHHRAV